MPEVLDDRFERAAMPHLDAVYQFAHSLTRDAASAEDLAQDTFLQAYRRFETFEYGTNCKAWLFRICKNKFIDGFRERKRRGPHSEISIAEPAVHDADSGLRTFEKRGIDNEEIFLDLFGDEINRFLAELPDPFRQALILCDVEGMAYQEIADVLGVPIGTVRSRISRARSFLRDKLEDYASELGYTNQLPSRQQAEDE